MADIFISYKKTDYAKVAPIKRLLEAEGWSVWIDTRLEAGDRWDAMIERELATARCVVVVWTPDSIDSRWVRTEANEGLDRNILVPVTMGAKQPLAFKLVQFADLLDWDGAAASPRAQTLISGVRAMLGKSAPPPQTAAPLLVDKAEHDWESFAIGETKDIAIVTAYIQQYERTEPLWAARARQRLEVLKVPIAEQEAARVEVERKRFAEAQRRDPGMAAARVSAERKRVEEERRREQAEHARAEAEVEAKARAEREAEAWRFEPVTIRVGPKRWEADFSIRPGSGVSFRDLDIGPEMVVVPLGRFMMGSPEDEPGRIGGQQHEVMIPKPFAVGKYAVTFDEWDAYTAYGESLFWGKGERYKPGDGGWGRGRHPVINVSWDDAQAYVKWLSEQTCKAYRLLSEAEWEYACRAGTTTPFWWGYVISPSQANYGSNQRYRAKTVQVDHKEFQPNPWGLYQMNGNVWEWCMDCWNSSYRNKPANLKANGGAWTADGCVGRVLRGGSWLNIPQHLESTHRSSAASDYRNSGFGFRVARTIAP